MIDVTTTEDRYTVLEWLLFGAACVAALPAMVYHTVAGWFEPDVPSED